MAERQKGIRMLPVALSDCAHPEQSSTQSKAKTRRNPGALVYLPILSMLAACSSTGQTMLPSYPLPGTSLPQTATAMAVTPGETDTYIADKNFPEKEVKKALHGIVVMKIVGYETTTVKNGTPQITQPEEQASGWIAKVVDHGNGEKTYSLVTAKHVAHKIKKKAIAEIQISRPNIDNGYIAINNFSITDSPSNDDISIITFTQRLPLQVPEFTPLVYADISSVQPGIPVLLGGYSFEFVNFGKLNKSHTQITEGKIAANRDVTFDDGTHVDPRYMIVPVSFDDGASGAPAFIIVNGKLTVVGIVVAVSTGLANVTVGKRTIQPEPITLCAFTDIHAILKKAPAR